MGLFPQVGNWFPFAPCHRGTPCISLVAGLDGHLVGTRPPERKTDSCHSVCLDKERLSGTPVARGRPGMRQAQALHSILGPALTEDLIRAVSDSGLQEGTLVELTAELREEQRRKYPDMLILMASAAMAAFRTNWQHRDDEEYPVLREAYSTAGKLFGWEVVEALQRFGVDPTGNRETYNRWLEAAATTGEMWCWPVGPDPKEEKHESDTGVEIDNPEGFTKGPIESEPFPRLFSGLKVRFLEITLKGDFGGRIADPKREPAEHFAYLADIVAGVASVWEGLHDSGALDGESPMGDRSDPNTRGKPLRRREGIFYQDDMLTYEICEHINHSERLLDDSEVPTATLCQLAGGLVRIASLVWFSGADITKRLLESMLALMDLRSEVYWVLIGHLVELRDRDPEGYETFGSYWKHIAEERGIRTAWFEPR